MREISIRGSLGIDDPAALGEDIVGMREAIGRVKSGAMPEEEFRRYRLHRGIYGQRADQPGFNMVRVKVPYGMLSSAQLRQLGEIARTFADGLAHLTTRQDVQFHWVRLENVPEVMDWLAAAGLTTREACGNTVRNIVGSPLAGVARDEAFDVSPYARLLAGHLLRNPLNQQLPRKFKISFSGNADESDGIIPWIHDIGYVARVRDGGGGLRKGFAVYAGGGLGAQPRVADLFEEFMPAELLIPTTEAMLTVFNALGNRENRNKARMKYVLWKLGLEEFRRRVGDERSRIVQGGNGGKAPHEEPDDLPTHPPGGLSPVEGGEPEFREWLSTNVVAQKQAGYHAVYVNPTIGDLSAGQLFALAELAERFSDGSVRTTPQQDILLRWIPLSKLTGVHRELKKVGLHHPGAQTAANVTTCPGADTCNLGITHSRALGKELTMLFRRHPDWQVLLGNLRIKISGCPNSCGQHHVASIGFHGASKNIDGRQIPSYIVTLGGGLNTGKQVLGETIGRFPARKAVDGVSRIVKQFLSERAGEEDFLRFVERVGVRSIREGLKDLTDIRSGNISEDLFVDLGQTMAFNAKTGEGECAA